MKLHNYSQGVLHIVESDPFNLAHAFLRVQESSSNPQWMNRGVFTEQEFMQEYDNIRKEKKDRWEYHKEYFGFSVGSSALIPFYQGKFNPISKLEDRLLELLDEPTDSGSKRSFIIGSMEGDITTMRHEISIALFHVDPDYCGNSLYVIDRIPRESREKMNNWFINDGSYSPEAIPREIVAEFADWVDSYMFKEAKIDRRNSILQSVHREIRDLFEEKSKSLNLPA